MTNTVLNTGLAGTTDSDRRLRELVDSYREPLTTYARRLTDGDNHRAEEAVQEAFVRAWRHLDKLTPDQGPVLGWLRRVVHNLVMDGYRTRKARPAEVALDQAADVALADPSDDVDNRVLVEQVLGELWPQHRAALIEVYLHGRSAAEIGASLGVPVGTVKSRVHYALRAARRVLADRTPCAA
ncbi:sigma-70 family RNA polymerase sigma factor [Dactylosporangium sp. CA-233914]|uniref:sigma-70 family RNA polymerase sigma factor n=1 Tax=Dactylosporangium sp. CA-233914 TaxID=3239934 RepID=UPI003D918B3A